MQKIQTPKKNYYLVVHLYLVVFCGFNTDQKDLVAEKLTGMRACNKSIDDHGSLSETVTHILPLGGGH